jgi:hypothetical protein
MKVFLPNQFPPNPVDDGEHAHAPSLTVVFTTPQATLVALKRAEELAGPLRVPIQILVPQVVPYPLPIDRPQIDPNFKVRHLLTVSMEGSTETRVDVRLCRDSYEGLVKSLPPHSVVLLGGRRHWWPTYEARLAGRLHLAGHHVIFVPQM